MIISNNLNYMSSKVSCPCCNTCDSELWATELNYKVVRCLGCSILYVNPRPDLSKISSAVRTGEHDLGNLRINVKSRRIDKKVKQYKRILSEIFADVWKSERPILWIDVGSGYGETLDAIAMLAHHDSKCIGVEPMEHKAEYAKKLGLTIYNSYLEKSKFKADIISAVDIFSHIPDFHSFLNDVVSNLKPNGEIFIETGNLADLKHRSEFPGELGLPDHLVFAGEQQIIKYLDQAGFDLIYIRRVRIDGLEYFMKNIVKKLIGRPAMFCVPYSSKYRQLRIRAKLKQKD